MCGRYTLTKTGEMPEFFEISEVRLPPRFNIAPTQDVPVIRSSDGARKLDLLRWGLVPRWAKDPSIGARMINSRLETVEEKPSFRVPFQRQRCIVPADGFFEWRNDPGGKQPYYFTMKSGAVFGLAGLWDSCKREGEILETFSIITCEANSTVSPVHHRMPVILPRELFSSWLDPTVQGGELKHLLGPYPAEEIASSPVSRFVNNARNDSPECITPIQEA